MANLLKVCGANQNNVFRIVLLSLGLLFRWIPENRGRQEQVVVQKILLQILFCSALRAMTGPEVESAVILFGIFIQPLKLCGALHNFDHQPAFTLRRIDRSRFQHLSDCAAG